ncbi:Dynein assembly factor 3, axonemal [Borealophlyctis nickersoniae]|nr:Dynein assembly factor 3, axonemal [Borealophlyctis nickersoniae]
MIFHVIEPQSSILARNMLLLSVLFQMDDELGVQERVELFLELYGNILVREKTAAFIREQASQLIRVVTDGTGLLSKIMDFSQLKFRERDDLEFVFKFWRDEKRSFDVVRLWDVRLRRLYGIRYDSRENVIDWDYHMKLKVPLIQKREFMRWRLHGLAFEVRESSYEKANRTMATVDLLKQDGLSVVKWGFFSDAVSGPFFAFGTDSENKELLKTANGIQVKTSQEICEYNLRSLIHEMTTKSMYVEENAESMPSSSAYTPNNLKIIYHPCDPSTTLIKKRAKYVSTFHKIYLGNTMAHHIPEVVPLLREGGEIIAETAKFMLDLNAEQIKAFTAKLVEVATGAGLVLRCREDSEKDLEHLVFVVK